MNRFLFSLFTLLLLAASGSSQVNSPWKWSHPSPQGNTLRYVKVFSPTNWIAIGYSSTFMRTTNGGANWYIRTDIAGEQQTSQTLFYNGWFFDINTGFACGASGRIARTTNSGVTWDTVSSGVTATLYGMHFINSTTGFIGGSSGTVLKTTNGGLNWTALTTGVTTTINNIFALDVNNIYAPTTVGNIRVTTDGGTTWANQLTGASVTVYDAYYKNANTGIVCGSSTALRYTTDAGVTWTATNTGLPTSTFYGIAYDQPSNTWYASGNSFYAFRSTNDGLTWDSVSIAGTQTYVSTMYHLDRNGSTILTAGAFGLMNSSTNAGANWTAHNSLPYSSTLNDIWVDNMNGRVFAVGTVAPTPIMLSTNGGNTWSTTPGANITTSLYGIKMLNSNTGYVSGTGGKVFKTTNGGNSWDSVTFAGVTGILYCPDFIDVNTGWVCGASGVVKNTTDGGATWNTQTSGVTATLNRIDMVNATTGWFVGASGTVRKTTDGGTTWTAQTPNYTSTINFIQMFDANTGYLCALSGNLRRTTNGGANWDTVQTAITTSLYGLSFLNVNTGFVSGATGVTLRTSNGGTTWELNNTSGSTMNSIYAKNYDSAWVCGSSGAILKFTEGVTGTVTWSNEIPVQYELKQNYPNPFNPTTTIKFALPVAGKVSLKIYDIVGREVESLFNGLELNAGTVTYDFDGTNLASGVYFYTLIVNDNKIDTKKMVLVK